MKLLLLPVFCLLASCAGKSHMTVTSRSPEGITVAADWRHYAGFATNSAGSARRWFARQAIKLAEAEGQPVSAVRLQSATLKFQDFPGICIATMRGAALFGQAPPAGPAFHDGSSLMNQAVSEDRRIQNKLVAQGAFNTDAAATRPSQLHPRTRTHMLSMPQFASGSTPSDPPKVSRKTDAAPRSALAGRGSPSSGNTRVDPSGRTSARPGSTLGSSIGAASRKDGETWYHSKGVTSTRRGNVVYNSDGTSYTISSNGTMYLNGKGS